VKYVLILFYVIGALSCKNDSETIHATDGQNLINNFSQYKATVVTFLSPECPLSESYTNTLNALDSTFGKDPIRFIHVFPGTWYEKHAIDSFITAFNVRAPYLLDTALLLVNAWKATITPETFIFDGRGALVYSGAIDNWAVDLGQKRSVITERYVQDVLLAIIENKKIPYRRTQAVGCFIESNAHH